MKNVLTSKKKLGVTGLALGLFLLAGSSMAYAYSGDYSFDIGFSVTGDYDHSLSNSATSTSVSADTYSQYTGEVLDQKEKFTVYIEKKSSLTSYNTGQITANGVTVTKNFGTVSSGTYRVKVIKNTGNGNLQKVVGDGQIKQ